MTARDSPSQISLLDGSSIQYCMDSNEFYEFWVPGRKFDLRVFERFWEHISKQIELGIITSTEEVYRELQENNNEDFKNWLHSHKDYLYVENDVRVIRLAAKILNKYPKILFQKKKNGADAFVVATAKVYGLTVISEENEVSAINLQNGQAPKIPNLCNDPEIKINCITMLEYCERENIKLGPQ